MAVTSVRFHFTPSLAEPSRYGPSRTNDHALSSQTPPQSLCSATARTILLPGNSRYAAAHSAGRERALGLRSGDRPQRLCTVAQLALDARKDLGIPVGSIQFNCDRSEHPWIS